MAPRTDAGIEMTDLHIQEQEPLEAPTTDATDIKTIESDLFDRVNKRAPQTWVYIANILPPFAVCAMCKFRNQC